MASPAGGSWATEGAMMLRRITTDKPQDKRDSESRNIGMSNTELVMFSLILDGCTPSGRLNIE